jgi:hypothetical protein
LTLNTFATPCCNGQDRGENNRRSRPARPFFRHHQHISTTQQHKFQSSKQEQTINIKTGESTDCNRVTSNHLSTIAITMPTTLQREVAARKRRIAQQEGGTVLEERFALLQNNTPVATSLAPPSIQQKQTAKPSKKKAKEKKHDGERIRGTFGSGKTPIRSRLAV